MRTHRSAVRTALPLAALAAGRLLSRVRVAPSGNADAVRDDGTVDLSKVTLTVGDQKGGSKALLAAAGVLDELPYKVEWKAFTSGPPLLEALNAGAIDIGGVGNTPAAVRRRGEEQDHGRLRRHDGRQGRRDRGARRTRRSQDVADLKGKEVAVAKGSSANYNLLAQLAEAGLGFDDVEVQYLQPADALAAFSSGHVDAWAIWDPYTAQAELEAGARVLVDGGGLVNGMTFQAANPDALDDKATAAAIEDYVARLAEAQVWSNTHRDEWAEVWAEETGLPPEVTRRAVDRRVAKPCRSTTTVIASEQEMADAFVEAGLLPEEFDVATFFTDGYNDAVPASGQREGVDDEHQAALVPADHRRRPRPRRRRAQRPAGRRPSRTAEPGPPTCSAKPTSTTSRSIARTADQLGFEGVLTPTGHLVRGRLAGHLRADPGDPPAEVPGRVPARGHSPDAGRADGRRLPAHLRRPAAAQRRHRRRAERAAAVRRPPQPRRAVRPHRRVPLRRARRVDPGAVRLRRRALPGRGRRDPRHDRPGAGHLLRRLVRPGRAGGRAARRRLPHLG